MKIIEPSVEFITPFNRDVVLKRIEECGRTAYKSTAKEDSAGAFCQALIRRGHESALEHVSFTVRIICDRGVSHELVRHRLASYTQESTRYCNYSKEKFGREITVIRPCFFEPGSERYKLWYQLMLDAETAYMSLLDAGATPQEARSVLPNSLKTEIVMTANIREWRHFFFLRCAKDAHPQMRQIAWLIFDRARSEYPELFVDLMGLVYEGDPEYQFVEDPDRGTMEARATEEPQPAEEEDSESKRIMKLGKEVDKGLKKDINSPSMAFKEWNDAIAELIKEATDLTTEMCEQAKKEDTKE